jgi:hypothetical protein
MKAEIMTTSQNLTQTETFAIGEKVFWVAPTGYKETVTVSGRVDDGFKRLIVQTMYGLMIDFVERDGRFVGVEYWGYLEKKPASAVPVNTSIWTRIKGCFKA